MSRTLPPEWYPQSGVMLTWPHENSIWADMLDQIDPTYVAIAKAVARFEKLLVTAFDEKHKRHIEMLLNEAHVPLTQVKIYCVPSDDVWVRDHGPITVFENDCPKLLKFTFNGWGGKYPAEKDNQLVLNLHQQGVFNNTPIEKIDLVLEGGSIESDGQGTLLTTEKCLRSKGRHFQLSREALEKELKQLFGVDRVLWLEGGQLQGDDTDGHIDTIARFVDPHTICYVECDNRNDPHFSEFKRMKENLMELKTTEGRPYRLIPLPWPKPIFDRDGKRLPATYANFLMINQAVLAPVYQDPSDQQAVSQIKSCFPSHEVIPISSVSLVQYYGSIHCATMQLPRGIL